MYPVLHTVQYIVICKNEKFGRLVLTLSGNGVDKLTSAGNSTWGDWAGGVVPEVNLTECTTHICPCQSVNEAEYYCLLPDDVYQCLLSNKTY